MTPEHRRTLRRLAALAAFGGFWAALLVTIGFPALVVAAVYLGAVGTVAAVVEGSRVLESLGPQARRARAALSRGRRAAAGRIQRIDLAPARARAGRGAELSSRAGRRGAAAAARAASTAAGRVAAAGAAATAFARTRTETLRNRLVETRVRQSAGAEALRLNTQATTLRQQGRLDEALEASERALALVRGLGDRRAEALTLNGLGLTQARSGDEAGAIDSYETAVAILTELGDSHGAGRVLANLGSLHSDRGEEDAARARWTDALERLEPGSPEHERTAEHLRLAG